MEARQWAGGPRLHAGGGQGAVRAGAGRAGGLGETGPGQKYALQARNHTAVLRRFRPDVTIETWWRPAHKGVAGNEKAEPDARGVEWLSCADRLAVNTMPLPRSLAHLRREITEKRWAEAWQ